MNWFDDVFGLVEDDPIIVAAVAVFFPPIGPTQSVPQTSATESASGAQHPGQDAGPPVVRPPVQPAQSVPPLVTGEIVGLAAALRAANPVVDQDMWLPALTPAMLKAKIITPRRIAAFLGQISQEAGPGFHEVTENLNYTHAYRICQVFPSEFPTQALASAYVSQPEKLADVCYAHKLGNGGPESSWRFRGRGLIQLTGRDEYSAFAKWAAMTIDAAADYAATPEGAAASACWYWTWKSLNTFADSWDLATVTRRVNGSAMEGHADRVAMAKAALTVLGG